MNAMITLAIRAGAALLLAAPLLLPASRAQQLQLDFGDAPQVYPVTAAQNGARHVVGELRLGTRIDAESDGIPSTDARGDDITPAGALSDEDGVQFLTTFVPGQSATVRVTASAPGILNAWIDWNRNGSWADTGERVFADRPLTAGANDLSLTVPSAVSVTHTYARFRFSTSRGLLPTGLAENGEVEDYQINFQSPETPLDFGDAPEPYPTTLKENGARHQVTQGFHLGPSVDAEPDGQPNSTATGDDANPPTTGSDENGINFVTQLVPGGEAEVEVSATIPAGIAGRLDAWIDFNADGDWADEGERIFTSEPLASGINKLLVKVPAESKPGVTFSRWRLSLEGQLPVTGNGGPGEVEDHQVTIQQEVDYDFGDAPAKYPVTLAQDGARHRIVRGISLGSLVDGERDGQTSVAANGDDLNPSTADDEDGVVFVTPLVPGQTATVRVTASTGQIRLDAWIDWNRNESWEDAGEQVFVSVPLNFGPNDLTFTVPLEASVGDTFSRWRISFEGGLKTTGAATEGEVEDHLVKIEREELDFGDAPQSYPTLLSQNGARHRTQRGFHLGSLVDVEPDGQPSVNADGDDNNPTPSMDDEDGVRFIGPIQAGAVAQVEVVLTGGEGRLDAWLDFNANGTWDHPAEQIFNSVLIVSGTNLLTFNVPTGAALGTSYARFRLSRQGSLLPTGLASDGEVEDYRVTIVQREQPCLPRTNRGTNFWLTFPGNYAPDADNPVRLSLSIVGPRTTRGQVYIPMLNWTSNFVIGASMEITIPLPRDIELGSVLDTVLYRGVNVTAEAEVAVFGMNRVFYTTDAYLALPTDVIGRRYIVQGYGNQFTGVPDLNGTQFGLVATEDDTTVTITPSVTTHGRPAGVPYSIVLPKAGYTYQLRNTNDFNRDLSGTIIVADKTIAVFGGHQCAAIPNDDYFFCDYIVEQLLPVERAGMNFITVPLATRNNDTFRFTAVEDDTTISVNGAAVATIDAGRTHERRLSAASHVTANKPIFTVQYANSSDFDGVTQSDPFMMIVPHVNMFLNNYIISVPHENQPALQFADNYVNIAAPAAVVGSLLLDGAAVPAGQFTPIGATGFSRARIKVDPGMHTLSASAPFGVTVYGWNTYDSYGYPGGMFFGDTTPPKLTCPEPVTVVLNAAGTAAPPCAAPVPDFRDKVQVQDDCQMPERIMVHQSPAPGTVVGPGVHVITLSSVDAAGNVGTCQTYFEVIDPSAIELVCPQNLSVSCNAPGGAFVEYEVLAHQRCGNNLVPVECDPPSGSFFPEGETLVTCTAQDASGKLYSCEFIVTVRCTTPRITVERVPGSISLNWTVPAILEQAPTVVGPWTVVEDADGSFTVNPTGSGGFYRLRIE